MRDKGIYNVWKSLPRMSWHPKNLYNLWKRSLGPQAEELKFNGQPTKTLFQQRWMSKALVRAYHGDFIPENFFKKWFLPDNIPDTRPRRSIPGPEAQDRINYLGRTVKADNRDEEIEAEGLPPVGSFMFIETERRLDIFIFRCCFVHSVYEARRLIIHGSVLLNGKKHTHANTRLAPGDMVSVDPNAIRFFKRQYIEHDDINAGDTSLTPFALPHFASPWLFIPAYIEPSFATCSAVYVRHPTARPGYSEIPTPYDADGPLLRFAWEWYVKRRPRIRSKTRLARMPEDRALTLMQQDMNKDRKAKKVDYKRILPILDELPHLHST